MGAQSVAVLFDDGRTIVVNKPAGHISTGRDDGTVEQLVSRQVGHPVWPVHQLDQGTTGVFVLVHRRNLVQRWQRAWQLSSTAKFYHALVHGLLVDDERVIDLPLGPARDGPRQAVRPDGKPARTDVVVLARGPQHSLVQARLHTGRTHQIRAHLSAIGHPLVGDLRYGGPACTDVDRPALHAAALVVGDGRPPGQILAPWPTDLRALCLRVVPSATDEMIWRLIPQSAPAMG